jgi:Ni,Fe-hydrogenase I cytochrome b subunit
MFSDSGEHAQEKDWEERCLGGELVARGWHDADAFSEIAEICNHVWMVSREPIK